MLKTILATVCVALLTYSLPHAKRVADAPIPTIALPSATGSVDGSLAPDARFALAAANTTVLYSATFDTGGLCNEQGWTAHDVDAQPGVFWHVDDFAGVNVNPGDTYAPLSGAKSLWCGARAVSSGDLCVYAVLPGYGRAWSQAWRTRDCIPVTGTLDVSFQMRLDSEPNYDASFLEFTSECGADFRDNSWTFLAGGKGVWDGLQTTTHAASYNVGAGPVDVRLRFTSDGAFDDADGNYDSHAGPIVIDDLAVEGLALEDFEDELVGDVEADGWVAEARPAFGSYFALFRGVTQLQQDPCVKNLSCLWAAIAGSTETFACGGFPQQAAVPKGNEFGEYISNRITSPPIPISGTGSRVDLQFSVYRDLAIDDLLFYVWDVRSVTNGCPGPWRSRGLIYYGTQKDWNTDTHPIGDLIDLTTATHVQVRLGVFDRCFVLCGIVPDPCHGNSPMFDNVRVYRVDIDGPVWSTRDFDMFQDTFPTDGSETGIGRADAALSITSSSSPTILPGDSARVIVRDPITAVPVTNPSGLADDVALGGKQCYLWVHVIDSGVPSATKTGAVLTDHPNYPFKDTQVAFGKTWTRIRCFLRVVNTSTFVVDLNDNLFEAGDVIEFFFGATNTSGQTSYCSGSALDFVQSDVDLAAETASEFTILPLVPGLLGGAPALYVDGMDGRGAQIYWDATFAHLELVPDRYDVRGPTSYVANRPGTRVTDVATQLNGNYSAIVWDCGDLPVSVGDGSGSPEKSNDYAMLNTFLGGLASMGGVYICGDDAPQALLSATGASAVTFRSTYITYSLTTGDHRPLFGVSPIAVDSGLNPGDTFVLYGGCPLLNDFDVMTPMGSSSMAVSYGAPAATNGAVLMKVTGDARVVLSGFSLIYIRDDDTDGVLDRANLLFGILNVMDAEGELPTYVEPVAFNSLDQNYPNPFNPQTTIAFSIRDRGRVRIDVFDVAGARVRTLLDETRAAGTYSDVRWDGTNGVNQPVASGVYFYRIVAGGFSETRKMVLLK